MQLFLLGTYRGGLIKHRIAHGSCKRVVTLAWKQWNFSVSHVFNFSLPDTSSETFRRMKRTDRGVWISNCGVPFFPGLFFSFYTGHRIVRWVVHSVWSLGTPSRYTPGMMYRKCHGRPSNNSGLQSTTPTHWNIRNILSDVVTAPYQLK